MGFSARFPRRAFGARFSWGSVSDLEMQAGTLLITRLLLYRLAPSSLKTAAEQEAGDM
jgi:hypothetical protein